MNYIFMGFLYDKTTEKKLLRCSKSGLQTAPNQYQMGLVGGLESLLEEKISIISSYPVGSFPLKNKKLFYKKSMVRISAYSSIRYTGFVNFYILREIIRAGKMFKNVLRLLDCNDTNIVLVYGLELAFAEVIKKLKRVCGTRVVVIPIVPDLPGKFGVRRSIFTLPGIWDRLFVQKKIDIVKYADGYVLLTESMKYPLNIGSRPYCVVEGFLPETEYINIPCRISSKKTIMYAGSLNKVFGICHLVDAFTRINDSEYELWICGCGSGKAYVKKMAKIDKRITYYGYVSRKRVGELQKRATVLINPRRNMGEYTRYSFPSKTLECMVSGKPTIMYKLDGIPDEYDRYLYYVCDNEVDTLKDRIVEICSKPEKELMHFGQEARKWALSRKNNKRQASAVLNLINSILNTGGTYS